MKRIALLLCLLSALGTGHAMIVVNARVNFGAKRNGCERGLGICILQTESRNESGQPSLRISMSPDSRMLLIDFPEELCDQFPQQFRNGMFVQEEDYEVPDDILHGLESSGLISIPAGKYQLQRFDGGQRLAIPLVL